MSGDPNADVDASTLARPALDTYEGALLGMKVVKSLRESAMLTLWQANCSTGICERTLTAGISFSMFRFVAAIIPLLAAL